MCEQLLEDEGVLDLLTIGEFRLGLVPLDSDILTMEMDCVFQQVGLPFSLYVYMVYVCVGLSYMWMCVRLFGCFYKWADVDTADTSYPCLPPSTHTNPPPHPPLLY